MINVNIPEKISFKGSKLLHDIVASFDYETNNKDILNTKLKLEVQRGGKTIFKETHQAEYIFEEEDSFVLKSKFVVEKNKQENIYEDIIDISLLPLIRFFISQNNRIYLDKIYKVELVDNLTTVELFARGIHAKLYFDNTGLVYQVDAKMPKIGLIQMKKIDA